MIISAVSSIGTEEAREPNPCLTRLRIFIPDLRVLYFLTRQNIGTFSLPLSLPSKNYLTFLDQALTSSNVEFPTASHTIFASKKKNVGRSSTAATKLKTRKKSSRCLTSSDAPKSFTRFTATPPSFAPEQSTQVKAHTAESSPKTYTTAFR